MARKSRKNPQNTAENTPIFRVGGYVRLSAVDRKQKGDSIENQQAIIKTFVSAHPAFDFIDFYIDNGLSGQTLERPAFKAMLEDFESGKINLCITKDFSRLGRSAIDTGYYIEKYFPTHNIRYISINDNYDSDNGSGGIMVSLKNMVNEAYALEIGRKIHTTKQMNIQKGLFVGAYAPYGYLKNPQDNHKLIVDEYAGKIVTQIFEKYDNDEKISEIADWLNSSEILPSRRYLASIGAISEKMAGKEIHWNKTVLYAILKNQIYCGDMVQGKGKTHCYSVEKVEKSDWIIVKNTHEPLVKREIFERIQHNFSEQKHSTKVKYQKSKSNNIFLRKIFCGYCGHAMPRRKTGKNEYRFYCATHLSYAKEDCKIFSIDEEILREKLVRIIKKEYAVLKNKNTENSPEYADFSTIHSELEKNKMFQKSLYENFINDIISESEYAELTQVYGKKISDLIIQEKEFYENIQLEKSRDKIFGTLEKVKKGQDLTAEIIEILIEKILIFEDKSIEVFFKFSKEREGVKNE